MLCRGETFRKAFSLIGEVRSLLPDTVRIMALTATATTATRTAVCKLLGMVHPSIISRIPNKVNIKYVVHTDNTLEEAFTPIVEELRSKRTTMIV